MRNLILVCVLSILGISNLYSQGVGVVNASTGIYLKMNEHRVSTLVENQVAVITSINLFKNVLGGSRTVSFAFPLPEGASATGLKWKVDGVWHIAQINPTPQDTTLPGSGTILQSLKTYLGRTPLYFSIPQQVKNDSTLTVELTYVQLLKYEFGYVDFLYPSDYRLIQNASLNYQLFEFNLTSQRTIDSIRMLSTHPVTQISNNGNNAYIKSEIFETIASSNLQIRYRLNLTQLGLFAISSAIPDSILPDTLGRFFMFAAEPDPSPATQTIKKVFTLIVDRSGSMDGTKIVQAKNCASFIMNNLNDNDKFNIVDFESNVYSFRNRHVNYTTQTRDSALLYINNIFAGGGTNISGAFGTAVPQFSAANDSTANIIIFFTDGMPTAGITETNALTTYIRNLVLSTETRMYIYSFGIGTDVNQQLLTLISAQNNGLSEFLLNDELQSRISNFYLKIRNPVLLNTQITFSSGQIREVYPVPLPNLYKGQQMIVTGRYRGSGPVTVTLSGTAFNHPVSYQYTFNRADSNIQRYQFLTKIWAKQKIDVLLIQYYSLDPGTPEAQQLKQRIILLSQQYGVISPFTSFGTVTGISNEEIKDVLIAGSYRLIGNYPNPFNPSTTIKFAVGKMLNKTVNIKIYNLLGQLIRVLPVRINDKGVYEVKWNGDTDDGITAATGLYFYVIDFGDAVLSSKMIFIK
jgi:Ca-activated chloride channel family protein